MAEEQDDGKVTIGNIAVRGWIDEENRCSVCGGRSVFDFDFDARFCPSCDTWLEGSCDDPTCGYCAKRPNRPLARPEDNG
jgi:hypothetical protein